MEICGDSSGIDVVCAGESMAMFVPELSGSPTSESRYRISVAGAESNVATYLAMLGVRAAWVSHVGADPFGDYILEELGRRGVDVSHTFADSSRPTGVAFKDRSEEQTLVRYYRAGSAASDMGAETARTVHDLDAKLVHLSGITPALSSSCKGFVHDVMKSRRDNARVSFDVNWRPVLWKDGNNESILTFARAADIVFVGLDEAQALWGSADASEVRRLLHEPEILVVKQGSDGATVFHHDQWSFIPALTVDVVEPVGAGDAFAAGFLAGQLAGMSVERSARLGTILASSTLSVATDVSDLPAWEYVEELLQLEDEEWQGKCFALTDEKGKFGVSNSQSRTANS